MENQLADFGMIGLGVMGRNLLLNMADHGFKVAGFDLDAEKAKALETAATPGTSVKGLTTLAGMLGQLQTPRKIMLLVPAGNPVDDVIEQLLPLLEKGDIVIDGGNSHYTDTLRRVKSLETKGFHFMGMGVSGGEEGARNGPSIMPGGDLQAWKTVQPILEAVSAKVDGQPCVAYMGKDAAGHYVKMVHNGIEYAIMQLISEVYDILKHGLGMTNQELHEIFKKWNEGELSSFLVEITASIFLKKDPYSDNSLVDMILDKAGSKGTGKWTSQDAMNLPVSIPSIDMAVAMRDLSTFREERTRAASIYHREPKLIKADKDKFISQLSDALQFGSLICYAQGLAMLSKASGELNMDIPLKDVVKIWRGGCIIRSTLLEVFYKAYHKKNSGLPNILLDKNIARLVRKKERGIRNVIKAATQNRIACSGLASTMGYFDAYTSAKMPVNLIQAQRDYFGAHTYQRIDREGSFHTSWDV